MQLVSECNTAKNKLSNRSGYSPVQRVFGAAYRLPGDLTSDDHVHPEIFRDLGSTDPSFEEARLIREAACKAHASVSIRDRFDGAVQARWWRPAEASKADDVIMVWRVPVPSKGGKRVGPGAVIINHHGTVWTSMRGSLWKCTAMQCKLAADDEARGLEIQNARLADLRADLQDGQGRKSYVDVTNEKPPEPEYEAQAPAQEAEEPEAPAVPPGPAQDEELKLERELAPLPEGQPLPQSTASIAPVEPASKRSRTTRRGKRSSATSNGSDISEARRIAPALRSTGDTPSSSSLRWQQAPEQVGRWFPEGHARSIAASSSEGDGTVGWCGDSPTDSSPEWELNVDDAIWENTGIPVMLRSFSASPLPGFVGHCGTKNQERWSPKRQQCQRTPKKANRRHRIAWVH